MGHTGKILTTEDCRATQEPIETPYGLDSGFRDPSGNSVRLTQLAEVPGS